MKNRAYITPQLQQQVFRGLVVAGGLYLGYRVGSRVLREYKERRTASLADQSAEVRQAMGLRSAMNPSGVSWMMWADGTNEDAIAQIATQIVNLDAVASSYRNLYRSELVADLQGELNSDDFNAFLQTISNNRINQQNTSGGNTSAPGGAYTQAQRLIVAKQAVFVRTSPDASYHGAWYEVRENKNIFKKANPGEFIGYATGKQHFDPKNKVKFIEVAYKVASTGVPPAYSKQAGQTKILWVSASANYTEQFSLVSAMEAKYAKTRGVTKYLLPINALGWLSLPGSRIITTQNTAVLDEQFQPISSVAPNVLLGYPVMGLSGNGMDYMLIRTLEGQDRWVNSNHIILN